MSHATYEWVMSHICVNGLIRMSMSRIWMLHMNVSYLIRMRHVANEWVLSQINESCRIWMRHNTWMSHVAHERFTSHLNESCHTYEGLHLWHDTDDGRHVTWFHRLTYGVATISRLLKMIGLFCKRALENRWYSAKETYHFKEPTNRSHPISWFHLLTWHMTDHMTMMESR